MDVAVNRKIIFLVNPISGNTKKEALLQQIKIAMEKNACYFEIHHTNAAGDYSFLIDKIETDNITDIVIVGGDGTVNQVVYALKDTNVNFGIIPVGSGNGLALAAGISRN